MTNLIEKLINKKKITDKDIEYELYEICCNEHAGCNSECPAYDDIRDTEEFKNGNCPFFKDGKAMLKHFRGN